MESRCILGGFKDLAEDFDRKIDNRGRFEVVGSPTFGLSFNNRVVELPLRSKVLFTIRQTF